jgi:hypothetical protein
MRRMLAWLIYGERVIKWRTDNALHVVTMRRAGPVLRRRKTTIPKGWKNLGFTTAGVSEP